MTRRSFCPAMTWRIGTQSVKIVTLTLNLLLLVTLLFHLLLIPAPNRHHPCVPTPQQSSLELHQPALVHPPNLPFNRLSSLPSNLFSSTNQPKFNTSKLMMIWPAQTPALQISCSPIAKPSFPITHAHPVASVIWPVTNLSL